MKTYLSPLLALIFLLSFSACSDDDDDSNNTPQESSISAKLASSSQYSLFSEAIDRSGLKALLDGEGSFTVFAPTNNAINSFINDQGYNSLDGLIQGLGANAFREIISYHIMKGEKEWSAFQNGYYSSIVQGNAKDSLRFFVESGSVLKLNATAEVMDANISARNGLIHGVNAVMQPLSLYGLIEVNPRYSSLEAAIGLADGNLRGQLSDESQSYTFFAPNNTAFDTVVARTPGVSTLFEYVASLGTGELAKLILYHGAENALLEDDLNTGNLNSLADNGSGTKLQFFVNIGSNIRLIDNSPDTEDATVRNTDIVGTNGVLHLIDAVMLPN